MAIEKMYLVNVVGPIESLDCFVIRHILNHEIQLVPTEKIVDNLKGIKSYKAINPFEDAVKKLDKICERIEVPIRPLTDKDLNINCAIDINPYVDEYLEKVTTLEDKRKKIEEKIKHYIHIKMQILPIKDLDIEVDKLFKFKFMKFRFGKMPIESFEKLQHYSEKYEVVFNKVYEDNEYVYLIYFMPGIVRDSIDSLFASLFFERIRISDEVSGKPIEALEKINKKIQELMLELADVDKEIANFYNENNVKLIELYSITHQLQEVYKVRQYAMHSYKAFYLSGWIPESERQSFLNEVKKEKDITCVISDELEDNKLLPPTKLLNKAFVKPFEVLVGLYGVPSYGEMDPTTFISLTYLLLFGMMFGDLGQGIVFILLGLFLYKATKNSIGLIVTYVGIASSIFGLVYGSFFGNEEFIEEYLHLKPLVNPMHQNELILSVTIAVGVFLIIIALILNIVKYFKNKQIGKALVDKNGLIGLVFYLILLGLTIDFLTVKKMITNTALASSLIIIPIIIIFLSHPLQHLIDRKKPLLPEEKGTFFIEAFFELFEGLLSILSNTVSFVRVGAFALNHVGFFMAFSILGEMQGATGNVLIMIFGNVFVILLEGMVVAIQALRLEYYELFSRFFDGDGIPFEPFKINFNHKS